MPDIDCKEALLLIVSNVKNALRKDISLTELRGVLGAVQHLTCGPFSQDVYTFGEKCRSFITEKCNYMCNPDPLSEAQKELDKYEKKFSDLDLPEHKLYEKRNNVISELKHILKRKPRPVDQMIVDQLDDWLHEHYEDESDENYRNAGHFAHCIIFYRGEVKRWSTKNYPKELEELETKIRASKYFQ